jgi:aryl-alcohol dehydrogenase-like predicted oxidoreductase
LADKEGQRDLESVELPIVLGTANFGQEYGVSRGSKFLSNFEIDQILSCAVRQEIKFLDTAPSYGQSEILLGNFGLEEFQVTSKIPPIPTDVSDVSKWIYSHFRHSLRRLKIDRLCCLLVHQSDQLLGSGGVAIIDAMRSLIDTGEVEKLGVSIYDPSELSVLDSRGLLDFMSVVQGPLNVFDQRIVHSGWLKRLKSRGFEYEARSLFLQGVLVEDKEKLPPYFERFSDYLDAWSRFVSSEGQSLVNMAITAISGTEGVSRLVVGVNSQSHLLEVIRAAKCTRRPQGLDFAVPTELLDPRAWPHVIL